MQLWLLRAIWQTRKVYQVSYTFKSVDAGSRSGNVNIPNVKSNKIRVVGLAVSSENDTSWQVKFYSTNLFTGFIAPAWSYGENEVAWYWPNWSYGENKWFGTERHNDEPFSTADYNTNSFIGNIEILPLSPNATGCYEGSQEANLYYQDKSRANELHVIAENIGLITSAVSITFLYTKAE